jgi:hypothetical protein
MELKLIRKYPGADSVIGELYVNGTFECYTLEDIERPVKVQNVTAIPRGKYSVVISFSNRFQKLMPEIQNVPNYAGVRIHSGNVSADTEGCILVGQVKGNNRIDHSRDAFNVLFPKLQAAAQTEKIFLEITG